ncbi:MAG: DUF488 domain-containing protein [Dehalococcoidia bacterium]
MALLVKRIYAPAQEGDGYRVLVDRLWPRGLPRSQARVDAWLKDLAPSDALRRWFGHDPQRWEEFQRRYREELQTPHKQALLNDLAQRARTGTVTLLFAARDEEHNNAIALQRILESQIKGDE